MTFNRWKAPAGTAATLAVTFLLLPWLSLSAPIPATNHTAAADEPLAQTRIRLVEAQTELNDFLAAHAGNTNVPPGVAPSEVLEHRFVLQAVVRSYQHQLEDFAARDAAIERQHGLTETIQAWSGFAEPPPYSILLVDALRDSASSLKASLDTDQVTCDIFEKLSADNQLLLSQSDRRLRSIDEELESAQDVSRRSYLAWQRTCELARSRFATANIAAFENRRQRLAAELAEHHQRLDFVRRQLALASQNVRFSSADAEKVLAGLDKNRRQLESENNSAELANEAAQKALAAADANLRNLSAQATNETATAVNLGAARQVLATRSVQAETTSHRLKLARHMLDLIQYERAVWQARFATFHTTDTAQLLLAYRRLENMQGFLQTVKPYFSRQIELIGRQISEEEEAIQNRPEAQNDLALARERLGSFTEREALFRSAARDVDRAERLLVRWKESLDEDRRALPLTGKVHDLFTELSSFTTKLWNFELFAAEDTITVEGQQITGRRSVTVSKVVRAVVILAIGFVLATLLARLVHRAVIRRLGVEPNQATLIRRWTRLVLILLIIVLSLVWVKIPLTVFAFLGGALAIGFGFGTQNLLKNFISGIIILFERPFRVGDVIAVGGQCGTVTSIGIRSSILEIGDGTETLIPNSALLENNLTNWTYSNRNVRSTLSVVVASDSDTRKVVKLLTDSAQRHGLILKKPEPEVLFKDFEENGFSFELRYWLDIRSHNTAQVASDLRHMIAAAFAEHRITISFPQRDLHLDSGTPLRVEVTPASKVP